MASHAMNETIRITSTMTIRSSSSSDNILKPPFWGGAPLGTPLGNGLWGPLSIPPIPLPLEKRVTRMVSPQPPRPSSFSPVVALVTRFGDALSEPASRIGWTTLAQAQKFEHIGSRWCSGRGHKDGVATVPDSQGGTIVSPSGTVTTLRSSLYPIPGRFVK